MAVSGELPGMDGSATDSENWAVAGIALRSPLKPILTRPAEKRNAEEEFSTTPTSAESRIPSELPCPPAPKKRKSASSRCHHAGPSVKEFFNPPDLETIFMCRVKRT